MLCPVSRQRQSSTASAAVVQQTPQKTAAATRKRCAQLEFCWAFVGWTRVKEEEEEAFFLKNIKSGRLLLSPCDEEEEEEEMKEKKMGEKGGILFWLKVRRKEEKRREKKTLRQTGQSVASRLLSTDNVLFHSLYTNILHRFNNRDPACFFFPILDNVPDSFLRVVFSYFTDCITSENTQPGTTSFYYH